MAFRLAVMTVAALAVLGTFESRVVALAVLFLAEGFFACAFAGRNVRRNALEVTWLPVVDDTSSSQDLLLVPVEVFATDADTMLGAGFALCETLAI